EAFSQNEEGVSTVGERVPELARPDGPPDGESAREGAARRDARQTGAAVSRVHGGRTAALVRDRGTAPARLPDAALHRAAEERGPRADVERPASGRSEA